ncbi:MAG: hypothetical protein R6T78_02335 [Dehalococcoidales bacterium]
MIICLILGLDNSRFWDIKVDLGGISIFEYAGDHHRPIKHNDTTYLGQLERLTQRGF